MREKMNLSKSVSAKKNAVSVRAGKMAEVKKKASKKKRRESKQALNKDPDMFNVSLERITGRDV